MRDLNLSQQKISNKVHFSVTQNEEIFIVYRSTKARSVHENDQHVQDWNPTTFFLEN